MNKNVKSLLTLIAYIVTKLYSFLIPIKKNRFLFFSMAGNSYGDSVKSISDYIESHYDGAEIIWAFSRFYYETVNCTHKKVVFGSFRYYFYVITSKFYITNCFVPLMYIKRKGQVMLQTWHGTALKRIGYDAVSGEHSSFINWLRPNTKTAAANNTDIFMSGSRFMSGVYRTAFKYPNTIYETGTPRNDIFFQDRPDIIKKVRKALSIDHDSKLILYTPTFRNGGTFEYYDIDLNLVKSYYQKVTGEKYTVLVRLHPGLVAKSDDFEKFFGTDVINVTLYPDIQDLLYVTDILITDYSSTMFDFMYSFKPVIMYVPDIDTYNRGFYFDIAKLPFMISNNNRELRRVLQEFRIDEYQKRVSEFIDEIGSYETGHATEYAYQLLMSGSFDKFGNPAIYKSEIN